MFNSYVTNYQRVTEMGVYFKENPYENGFGGTGAPPFFFRNLQMNPKDFYDLGGTIPR